jgi:hypothetical protein
MINHGTSDAFSTGSHAQKPPKVSDSYAQAAPIIMPSPRMAAENNAHGIAAFVHPVKSLFQRPAIAYAKGTSVEAKPRNNTGGCITIQ